MAIVRSSVTGMVAADDWVPSAVKYAGIIDHSSRSGLRVVVEKGAATEYWNRSTATWSTNITAMILMNVDATVATSPVTAMLRKMQNI